MRPIHFRQSARHPDKFSPDRSIPLEETEAGPAGLGDIDGRTRARRWNRSEGIPRQTVE